LTTDELANAQISLKIAEKMSEIHSLDIPVSKEPDWLFLTLNRWLNNVETIMNDVKNNNNNEEENEGKDLSLRMSKIDFRKEVQWLRKVIETEACPVVFCHNDLQEGNILFRQKNFTPSDAIAEECNEVLNDLSPLLISSATETKQDPVPQLNGNSRKRSLPDNSLDSEIIDSSTNDVENLAEEPELMIIDFEYCAYNYRAFDIANHFLGECEGDVGGAVHRNFNNLYQIQFWGGP
jgi:choline/ethanolamine kinase